jgi:flagellar export protein FliJ
VTFKFRAAGLLDLRRRQLEEAKGDLARAQEKLANSERAVAEATAAKERAEQVFQESLFGGFTSDDVQRHRNWMTYQHGVVSLACGAREACQRAVDETIAVVIEKRRQVRVLERLRDRAWRRYLEEVRRREMKEIDLFAILQHARKISEGVIDRDGRFFNAGNHPVPDHDVAHGDGGRHQPGLDDRQTR